MPPLYPIFPRGCRRPDGFANPSGLGNPRQLKLRQHLRSCPRSGNRNPICGGWFRNCCRESPQGGQPPGLKCIYKICLHPLRRVKAKCAEMLFLQSSRERHLCEDALLFVTSCLGVLVVLSFFRPQRHQDTKESFPPSPGGGAIIYRICSRPEHVTSLKMLVENGRIRARTRLHRQMGHPASR